MAVDVRIKAESAVTAEDVFEPVCQLYASIFSGPPFNRSPEKLAAQRRSLRALMAEPTFGLVTAWHGNMLVGFAYGYALGSDTRWWDGFLTPVADEVTREWDGRTFVIIDMLLRLPIRVRALAGKCSTYCLRADPKNVPPCQSSRRIRTRRVSTNTLAGNAWDASGEQRTMLLPSSTNTW